VIGHDFFRRFTVEVNRDRGTVVLHHPASFDYRGSGRIVPLEFDGRQIYARAAVTSAASPPYEARLHVDTGASGQLVLIPGSKPEITAPKTGDTKFACFAGGSAAYRVGAPVNLDIAGARTSSPVHYALGKEVGRSHEDGRIGAPLLARFNVIFDYSRKRMILEPRLAPLSVGASAAGMPSNGSSRAPKPG
jgi:hypothetical protein